MAAVFVKSSTYGSGVVRVPLDPAQATAQQLQARVESACRLGPGSVEQLSFQGQPLPAGGGLARAGASLGFWRGGPAPDEGLYPNCWFASPLNKAFQKPLDASWPPLRHVDFVVGFGWVFVALAALFATSLLPQR